MGAAGLRQPLRFPAPRAAALPERGLLPERRGHAGPPVSRGGGRNAEGKLCLSSLGEVSKVITAENASAILPRFFHLSAREAKEVAAAIAPHPAPPVREVVTAVRPPEAPRDPGATITVALPAVRTSGLQT